MSVGTDISFLVHLSIRNSEHTQDGLKSTRGGHGAYSEPFRPIWTSSSTSLTIDGSVRFDSRHDGTLVEQR